MNRVGEFRRADHAEKPVLVQVLPHRAQAEIAATPCRKQIGKRQRPQRHRNRRIGKGREGGLQTGAEGPAPIDMHIGRRVGKGAAFRRHQHQLFFCQQFHRQIGLRRRIVDHGKVQRAVLNAVQQSALHVDLGAQCGLRKLLVHPDEPVRHQRIPQTHFGPDTDRIGMPRRQCHALSRAFPHLNQC